MNQSFCKLTTDIVTVRNTLLGRHLSQADTPAGQTLPGQTLPGQTCPRQIYPLSADTPLGRHPPAQCMLGYTPPAQCMLEYTPCPVHAGIHHRSGWYASNWNAFLISTYFINEIFLVIKIISF